MGEKCKILRKTQYFLYLKDTSVKRNKTFKSVKRNKTFKSAKKGLRMNRFVFCCISMTLIALLLFDFIKHALIFLSFSLFFLLVFAILCFQDNKIC